MINLKDFIFTADDLITEKEADIIISSYKESNQYNERCFESNTSLLKISSVKMNSLIPGTEAFDIVSRANDDLLRQYHEYLNSLEFIWTDGFFSTISYSHNYRLMRYNVGQSIHDHTDKDHLIYGSATLSLNDDYDGGMFRFFKGKHKVRTKPYQGMVFPAETYFIHGVEHITRGTRWSVNSFLGTEECVIGEHLNEQGKWQQYNKNYWRHDSCVPYINIKQNNVNAFHEEFSSQEEFDDVMMGRKRKPHLES